jgi:LPS sulfotransferase NodH
MNLYKEQFSSSHDFPLVDEPSKILIIASTGRSGSHMLGHSLYESGYFGFPLEYANPSNIAEWKNRFGVNDFFQVLEKIQERRTSANGVFSIKVHYPHIKLFGEFKQLVDFFPNAYFILLSRENVLRQAVSLSIARQTGVWISGQKPIDDNPTYDFKDIDKCLRETIINNSSWRYKLAASGCNYIEMTFEKICEDLSLSIKNIADFMDIDIDL